MLWNPLGALFEQVQDFADIDENGISPLDCCCAALKERFAGVQAYHLDSRIWLDISRGRIYLCAISEALGGQKAASVWVAKVSEVVKHRQLCKPTAIIAFKRKVWRRAVQGKGKLAPSIEKALKDKKFDQTAVGM